MTNAITWAYLLSLGLISLIGAARWGLPVYVKHLIDAKFDRELESFRSALRTDEQRISSLQNAVLNGSTSRAALLADRRMRAIEGLWEEVCRLGRFRMLVSVMQIVKVGELAARAAKDAKVREWITLVTGDMDIKDLGGTSPSLHRPFVSDQTWAAYSVYASVITYSVATLSLLKLGGGDPREYMDAAQLSDMVKAALPHQAQYIDRVGEASVYYLIDQLYDAALTAIRTEIEGRESDQQSVEQAKRVIKLVEDIQNKARDLPVT